ncbi:hypothetical protein [Streptomyces sp. NPDC048606]|uniref:hypothetical protein n=1 Tax=Streptomyces sp. NPDC048606 TaxID=3154726 RepID=UPI0034490513
MPHTTTIAITTDTTLNLAYQAFLTLQHPHYHAYAHARLAPARAEEALHDTFDTLATHWTALVCGTDLTARAWDELTHQVQTRTGRHRHPTRNTLQDDLEILTELGYTPTHCADITGRDPAHIHALKAARQRT